MADPRFYDNRGPFTLAGICAEAGIAFSDARDGDRAIADLASLDGAGPDHLTFFLGGGKLDGNFRRSRAGFCLVPERGRVVQAPDGMVLLPCADVGMAWVAVASLFYPGADAPLTGDGVDPSAQLGEGVMLAPGVVIGAGAEIGAGSHIGPGAVIGAGVAIGAGCRIGTHAAISHAYLGDRVRIGGGARIGQPGFGFASGPKGHVRIPQLGRVIVQDNVEIGGNTTVDRGALRDTVIGEGTKIDNQVQVGHNVEIGRHCIIAAQVGIAGSAVLEDFVLVGGHAGIGDHCRIGAGARLGGKAGVPSGTVLEGGRDYSGFPAKPIREWAREIHAVRRLARRRQDESQDDR